MALRGTLKDFGFPEILQLIGHQKKTGVLTLAKDDSEIRVMFQDGRVVGASSSQGLWGRGLGSICVMAGLLSDNELAVARELQRESLKPLETILLGSQSVKAEDLGQVLRLVMLETIYELFQWQSGTYEFEQKFVSYDETLIQPIPAESLMMEGYRIVDELPTFTGLVPDMTRVYQALPQPPERLQGLTSDERELHTALRSEHTPMELIFRRRVGKFDTIKGIAGLLQRGYIQAVQEEEALLLTETVDMERRTRLLRYAAYAVLGLCAVLLVRAIYVTGAYFVVRPAGTATSLAVAVASAQEERIVAALEAYRLLRGSYPKGLDALVQEGLLRRNDLVYPHGLPYRYTPPANGGPYRLESP